VHHDRLEQAGATFAATRIGENIEFLRSRDDWFRPVYLETGPDGALYVCDMYRKVIEHPDYLPVEVRKRTDFESGKGMGRIWRVTGPRESREKPPLAAASTSALVDELESGNSWRRDTAFRLLIERADPKAVEFLRRGLDKLDSEAAISSRLHLLSALGALDEAQMLFALSSPRAGVREVALKLAEPKLPALTNLHADVLRLATDLDPRVRFQCALVLGELLRAPAANVEALPALAGIATRDAADKWTRAAVLSSAAGHERELLAAVLRGASTENAQMPALLADLGRLLFRSVPDEQHPALVREMLFGPAADFDHHAALLAGFAEAKPERLLALTEPADSAAGNRLRELFQTSLDFADDTTAALPRRLLATKLLASASGPEATSVLLKRLDPGEPAELQVAAVRALTQPGNTSGVRELLVAERWAAFTPGVRATILGALLSRPVHQSALLDALESGAISTGALDTSQRELLRKSKNEAARERAKKILASAESGDRRRAFEEVKACLALAPVAANGRKVFGRLCASCHRLDREGVAVGPDLFGIRNQSKESILLHIVLPEQEVAPNFASYICETNDGRVFSGLIAAEAPGSVTLRQAQGLEETIPREEIASLTASPLSLMPQEMEKAMTAQELADLLAYLKGEAE
jgi:putative heme-binding domain-containing protein